MIAVCHVDFLSSTNQYVLQYFFFPIPSTVEGRISFVSPREGCISIFLSQDLLRTWPCVAEPFSSRPIGGEEGAAEWMMHAFRATEAHLAPLTDKECPPVHC